jgi:hypothetical protein
MDAVCSGFRGLKSRLPGLVEVFIDDGLQFVEVHLPLHGPLLQRGEGGVGEQLGHARNGKFGSGLVGAAEIDLTSII